MLILNMIQKRQRMNILQHFADILEVGGSSMNFIAVKKRVKDRMGPIPFCRRPPPQRLCHIRQFRSWCVSASLPELRM